MDAFTRATDHLGDAYPGRVYAYDSTIMLPEDQRLYRDGVHLTTEGNMELARGILAKTPPDVWMKG